MCRASIAISEEFAPPNASREETIRLAVGFGWAEELFRQRDTLDSISLSSEDGYRNQLVESNIKQPSLGCPCEGGKHAVARFGELRPIGDL
jgi:hypothetical protein